jgi:LTXXQ motif family protein
MWKPAVVAMAAIAGSSIVYAQQRDGGSEGYRGDGARFEHRHLSAEDRAAFADARIAALKAGLELAPDQAKNWPAFEQALRDMVELRAQRRAAGETGEQQTQNRTPTAPFDRLARRADDMAKTSAVLKRIADTGAPLYMSLNDAQKERFKKLAHMLRPHHRMHARDEGRGRDRRRDWRDGHGHGRDGEQGSHRWREGSGYGRDGGPGGQGWGHHGSRSGQDDGDQGGRMHRTMDADDQGTQL